MSSLENPQKRSEVPGTPVSVDLLGAAIPPFLASLTSTLKSHLLPEVSPSAARVPSACSNGVDGAQDLPAVVPSKSSRSCCLARSLETLPHMPCNTMPKISAALQYFLGPESGAPAIGTDEGRDGDKPFVPGASKRWPSSQRIRLNREGLGQSDSALDTESTPANGGDVGLVSSLRASAWRRDVLHLMSCRPIPTRKPRSAQILWSNRCIKQPALRVALAVPEFLAAELKRGAV
ncbi:hypothetical protein CMUS01_15638 [Colletotrichum musicola]|uniref:Uncharacterized protein n=1 Tax=Colletotrichum musicola TaxID=2175873 RepID=A0A8H6IUR5_9PEZI|nr:hypothetical protein CMUS01_15638 [Colletotrichum musicola]